MGGCYRNVKPASTSTVPRNPCKKLTAKIRAPDVGAAVLLVCSGALVLDGGAGESNPVLGAAEGRLEVLELLLVFGSVAVVVVLVDKVVAVSVMILVGTEVEEAAPAMALLAVERWAARTEEADASEADTSELIAPTWTDAKEATLEA